MSVLPYIILVAGAATLLALWCGWGLARLTLPLSLRPWTGLLAPLLGYAFALIFCYWLVRDLSGLPVALLILLPVAGGINAVAWWRTGPPRISRDIRGHAPLAALLLVTFVVGVLPLFNYGYPAVIGRNWDVENYLPISRYLERGPIKAIATAAPNPLRDLNAKPPSKGVTLGFPIWLGSVDVLTGSEAYSAFSIILSWLRMIGVMAVYVLFRATLGLRRPFALLGAAFASGGALLLWVSMFNFGMQLSAWPLIPLGLVAGVGVVQEIADPGKQKAEVPRQSAGATLKRLSVLLSGAVALGGMPVAYYPALTLFVPLAAGLGVPLFFQSKHKLRMLAGAVALGLTTVLLVLPTISEYFQGFDWRYGDKVTTLGVFKYIPLTDILGLTPFNLAAQAKVLPPVPVEDWSAAVAMAVLMLVALAKGPERLKWLGLVLGAAVYMGWLRWVQEYPYAWMKGGSYAAFPFLGLAAAGMQTVFGATNDRPRIAYYRAWLSAGRAVVAGLAVVFLVMMGLSERQIVAEPWARPRLYTNQMPDLLGLRAQIPAGSKVTITSDPLIDTVSIGLLSYLLDHTTMLGQGQTGYSGPWSNGAPDEIGDYGLLSYQEDPAPLGFSRDNQVWQGGSFILYKRAADVTSHLRLERTLLKGESLTLSEGDANLSAEPVTLKGAGARQVELSLATFAAGQVVIDGQVVALPAGAATLITGPLSVPHNLTITNNGPGGLTIRSATLRLPSGDTSIKVTPQPMTVVAQAASATRNDVVTTTVTSLLPNVGPLVLALDIWDTPAGLHYGWYGVEEPRSKVTGTFTFTLALKSGEMKAVGADGKGMPLGANFEGLKAGDYAGRLNIMAGTRLLATSGDLFAFHIGDKNRIDGLQGLPGSVVATAADRPLVPLHVTTGNEVSLEGYALGSTNVQPGEELSLTLWWRVLRGGLDERSILLHLRDDNGNKKAQADGPPANGARPTTTWEAGEVVVDKHTLKIPPDLAPGNYRLAVGMYHYPSLKLIPIAENGTELAGDVVTIPVQVKR